MIVPFKFLPHDILNKPKLTLVIRIFPQAPHEFFTPKPIEKLVVPPKPVTTIIARLWSQNPQPTKKKKENEKEKKRKEKVTHASPPTVETHRSVLSCYRPISHLLPTPSSPLRTSTTTEDVDHLHVSPPLSSLSMSVRLSSHYHSRRSLAP